MYASVSWTGTFYVDNTTLGNFGAVAVDGKKQLIRPIDLY